MKDLSDITRKLGDALIAISGLSARTPTGAQANAYAVVTDAVVGFVDIVASTKVCNALDLHAGYELKRCFHAAAVTRATEFGMKVLNHTGDGFLFMAKPGDGGAWRSRMLPFVEGLTHDFEKIVNALGVDVRETGLRFGASIGPVILGSLASGGPGNTAVGPDVNLAARLCSMAEINGLVVSPRIWRGLQEASSAVAFEERTHAELKGFDGNVAAIHIRTSLTRQASSVSKSNAHLLVVPAMAAGNAAA